MAAQGPKIPTTSYVTLWFGFFIVAVLFLGIGLWSATAYLSSAVVSQGVVTVDSNRKKIQHLEGGVVKEILVRDGDVVKANAPLVVLDETRPKANYEILRGNYDSFRATEARLLAERDRVGKISFPKDLLDNKKSEIAELIQGQKNLFIARRESMLGETTILKQRIKQLQEEISGLDAQIVSKERQIKLIKEELGGLSSLFKKGHASKPRMLALQREEAKLIGEKGELVSRKARANKSIGETKLSILQGEQKFRERVVTELREVRTRIVDLAERVAAAKSVLGQLVIRAPVSGTVVNLTVHSKRAVISAGQAVLEIVPEKDKLVIEARVQPVDVDTLVIGQEAEIRILAFKQRTNSSLNGIFTYISADRLTDNRTGESYYQAKIKVPENEISSLNGKQLLPGMPAEVIIKTGSRTALQYLLQPILDSMNRAWRED